MNLDIKLHKQDLPDQFSISDNIAVDCEFMGLNVERDSLCLVQISTGNNDAHIVQLNRELYNAPNLKKFLVLILDLYFPGFVLITKLFGDAYFQLTSIIAQMEIRRI